VNASLERKCDPSQSSGERVGKASTDKNVRPRRERINMRTFHDSKAMAKVLRERLAKRDIAVSHSDALELVAQQFGFDNWNVFAARIGGRVRLAPGVPILSIFDAEKAREFYIGFLGFRFDWIDAAAWKPGPHPLYTQISRGELLLHLSEHHGDASPGANVYVAVDDIDALHAELSARNYTYNKPGIETVPWGRSLQVSDPFGNRLRFTELNKR
jgi:catechol 2,3-dioxygenase-like lactoylglutathione lyase family enzyme